MNAARYDAAVTNLRETVKWLVGSIGAIFVILLAGIQFGDIPFATDRRALAAGAVAGLSLMVTFGLAIATLVGGSVSFHDLMTKRIRLGPTRRFINRTWAGSPDADPLEELNAQLATLKARAAAGTIAKSDPAFVSPHAHARFLAAVARWHIVRTRFYLLVVAMMLLIPVELIAAGIMVSARPPEDSEKSLRIDFNFGRPAAADSSPLQLPCACATLAARREAGMRHYRVNKLARAGGEVVKRKDILADDDRQAVARARNDDDCPVCDVWRDGQRVGSIT
jgi:hypothetical protein